MAFQRLKLISVLLNEPNLGGIWEGLPLNFEIMPRMKLFHVAIGLDGMGKLPIDFLNSFIDSVDLSKKLCIYIYILWHFFLWRAYSVSTARVSPKIRKFKNSKNWKKNTKIQKIENSKIQKIEIQKFENSKIQKNWKTTRKFKNSKIRKNKKTFENSKIWNNTLKFKIRKFHQPESISQGIQHWPRIRQRKS